eukprot:11315-Heterococcus_DN1.PRE.1
MSPRAQILPSLPISCKCSSTLSDPIVRQGSSTVHERCMQHNSSVSYCNHLRWPQRDDNKAYRAVTSVLVYPTVALGREGGNLVKTGGTEILSQRESGRFYSTH